MNILPAIIQEAQRARTQYGDFASTHEAYGVLAEEVAELLDAIRANKLGSVGMEAIQVAAVAMRLAEQAAKPTPQFAARSGGGK